MPRDVYWTLRTAPSIRVSYTVYSVCYINRTYRVALVMSAHFTFESIIEAFRRARIRRGQRSVYTYIRYTTRSLYDVLYTVPGHQKRLREIRSLTNSLSRDDVRVCQKSLKTIRCFWTETTKRKNRQRLLFGTFLP